MLLINDNQPEVPYRREEGPTGAHHHPDLPSSDPLPLIIPGALGDAAAEDGDLPFREIGSRCGR